MFAPNRILPLLACLLIVAVAPARAGVLSLDSGVYGVGALTLDTNQGLEFLDASLTAGRSFADVTGQLGAGGEFDGFRFATEAELFGLAISAGWTGPVIPGGTNTNPGGNELQTLVELLGVTRTYAQGLGSQGWIADAPPGGGVRWVEFYYEFDPAGISAIDAGSASVRPIDNQDVDIGSFLVRGASVPGPAAFSLLLVGLAGMLRRQLGRAA